MFYRGTGGGDCMAGRATLRGEGRGHSVTKLQLVTHQSLSPLCDVDKSSRADLPRSVGVVYETAKGRRKKRDSKAAATMGGGRRRTTVSNL